MAGKFYLERYKRSLEGEQEMMETGKGELFFF